MSVNYAAHKRVIRPNDLEVKQEEDYNSGAKMVNSANIGPIGDSNVLPPDLDRARRRFGM